MTGRTVEDIVAAFHPHLLAEEAANLQKIRTDSSRNSQEEDSKGKRLVDEGLRAKRFRESLAVWADQVMHAKVRVKAPRVLRARSVYTDDFVIPIDGVFVAVDAFLVSGKDVTRLTTLDAFQSRAYRRCPVLSAGLLVENPIYDRITADAPWLPVLVERRCSEVVAAVTAAHGVARDAAPGIIRSYREGNSEADRKALIDRLAEPLVKNALAKMDPASIVILLRSPPEDLEKVLRFMRTSKAVAHGATVESVTDAVNASIVMDVIDS